MTGVRGRIGMMSGGGGDTDQEVGVGVRMIIMTMGEGGSSLDE
jgi:hypothetical protein